MLDELRVRNLGLIERAEIEPGPGLVVVTGETGAGKTLLLGAVQLLTGGPARRDLVGDADEGCEVQGRFVIEGEEMVVTRRVSAGGRSRAYVDGEMVPARQLVAATAGVVELVAQHDQLSLTRPAGVRQLLDASLDREGVAALGDYGSAWARLVTVRDEIELLGGDRRALERELDMVRFQAEEITAAGFAPGEDEVLRAEAERLRNAEEIAQHLGSALRLLDDEDGESVTTRVASVIDSIRRAARYDVELEPLGEELEEAARLLSAATGTLIRVTTDADHDPGRLDAVEGRLALLGTLRRKYGPSLDDVLAFGEGASARAAELSRLLDRADGLSEDLAKAEAVLQEHADRLTAARTRAGAALARRAVEHLEELGFTDPVVRFTLASHTPGATGQDAITLEFASNAALEPGPVARVASGGELSRLILALRLAGGVTEAPVVAFDEIDAGVGGATALAMGAKLGALARERQVLVVTHLPQIAAHASVHFVVERSGNEVTVRAVSDEDRLGELARMLSGLPDSERGRLHAQELLDLAAGG